MWQGVVAERNGTFIMNKFIETQIRHLLTFVVAAVTWLVTNGLLMNDGAEEILLRLDGFTDFIAPLIAVVITRSLMFWFGRIGIPKMIKDLFTDSFKSSLFVACLALTALGLGSLVSCGLPVKGTVTYRHESGAKAGIEVLNGEEPRFWFRLPAFQNLAPEVISKLEEEHSIEPVK